MYNYVHTNHHIYILKHFGAVSPQTSRCPQQTHDDIGVSQSEKTPSPCPKNGDKDTYDNCRIACCCDDHTTLIECNLTMAQK